MFRPTITGLCCMLWCAGAILAAGPMVNESAREIPIDYDVDVVVVGGGTGAVSAAVASSETRGRLPP